MKIMQLLALTSISIFAGCSTSPSKIPEEDEYVKLAERSLRPQQELSDAYNEALKDPLFREVYAQLATATINGEKTINPQLKHFVKPEYPAWSRFTNTESRIFVGLIVDENGNVERLKLVPISGKQLDDQFIRSIETAVSQWKFTPGKTNNRPSKSIVVAPIIFELQ